jgi:AcrR family transcriptional regulator
MSAPGLMHYFPDLESLLLAVLDYRDAIDLDALGQPLTEPGGLRSYLDRVVRYNSERPEAARIYAMLQAESLNAEHAARSYFRRRTNSFVDEFARGLEDVSDEPRMLAQGIVAVLDGLQLHWLSNPEEFDLNRQWEALADLILPRTRDRP